MRVAYRIRDIKPVVERRCCKRQELIDEVHRAAIARKQPVLKAKPGNQTHKATNSTPDMQPPTPRNIREQSPLGALLRRSMAFVYDCFLLVAILFIITAIALVFNDGEAIKHPLYLVFGLIVCWLFFDWFWRRGGQTLGMRAWHLKLERCDDRVLTRTDTALRFVLGMLLFIITYITIPFDRERRSMHDRLTRTRIVRLRSQ